MNILVLTADGRCTSRPDTCLNRVNDDYYVPEGIDALEASPVAFVRVSRAGKAVGTRFVTRYYDAVSFGVLLYPAGLPFEEACCFDYTANLYRPLFQTICLERPENIFTTCDAVGFSCGMEGMKRRVDEAVVKCSSRCSLRQGDFVVVELAKPHKAFERKKGDASLTAQFCDNIIIDIKVKF